MSGCGKETKETKEKDGKECENRLFQAEAAQPIFTRNPSLDAQLISKQDFVNQGPSVVPAKA